MTNLIQNYRDFRRGTRFAIHGNRIAETAGFLLKGIPGAVMRLDRVVIAGTATDTSDANDIHNVRLVRTNSDGAPATPVLTASVTSGSSTTVFATGLAMTLNEHANRLCLFVTGANKSSRGIYQCRLIASNTTGGAITLSSALTATPSAGDKFVIMPANQADAAWSTSTLKTILPEVRLLRISGGRTVFMDFPDLDMPLNVGEGLGWFQTVHDNFASTEDAVVFTELSINVYGSLEGQGSRSNRGRYAFQPAAS